MEIKDYLHLYLGCDVRVKEWKYKSKFIELHKDGIIVKDAFVTKIPFGSFYLILRPLSDITEDEAKKYFGLQDNAEVYQVIHYEKHTEFLYRWEDDEVMYDTKDGKGYSGVGIAHNPSITNMIPEQFLFLLSKHFDLFGLIDAGLAIDATTLLNKDQGVQELRRK